MAFNLNDYEMVKDRIPLFYEKYSDGRITCDIITENADWVTMKAFLWKDMESQVANAPLSTGIAREFLVGSLISTMRTVRHLQLVGRSLISTCLMATAQAEKRWNLHSPCKRREQ